MIFDTSGKVLAKTGLSLTFDFEPFPESAFRKARNGEVATLTSEVDRVRAIIRLDNFVDAYLFVARFVDPEILAYIDKTKRPLPSIICCKEKGLMFKSHLHLFLR